MSGVPTAGEKAPNFALKDQTGKIIELDGFVGKKNVVLYFYPKDDTPGCTIEACEFRDSLHQFNAEDTEVLGVSLDDNASHNAFIAKFGLNFKLLSDNAGTVSRMYRTLPAGRSTPLRTTIIIDKSGKIVRVFEKVNPKNHAAEVLNVIMNLKSD